MGIEDVLLSLVLLMSIGVFVYITMDSRKMRKRVNESEEFLRASQAHSAAIMVPTIPDEILERMRKELPGFDKAVKDAIDMGLISRREDAPEPNGGDTIH